MHVAQETLGLRRAGLSPALSLLMSAFALPIPPAGFTPHLHRPTERSPTIQTLPSARLITIRNDRAPSAGRYPRASIVCQTVSEFRAASREPRRVKRAQVERLNP